MLKVKMPQINRKSFGKPKRMLRIPGGWQALVPQIKIENDYVVACTRYYMDQGLAMHAAQKKAETALQDLWNYIFLEKIKACVVYWASEYVRRFPHRLVDDVPIGFLPEEAQYWYMPGQNTGRSGTPATVGINDALERMARNVVQD